MRLVLIETSGNQNYIFATNKLRENVGASQLTFQTGTTDVLEAVCKAGGPDLRRDFPASLLDAKRNPPLTADSSYPVEVILAVSGKALLQVRDAATGRKIVEAVTLRALKEAPGLDVAGVVGSEFDGEKNAIHERIKEVHRQLEQLRSRVPGPPARFQRLPVVAECATSGLPAARQAGDEDELPKGEQGPRSAQSLSKQRNRKQWHQRLRSVLAAHKVEKDIPGATTELENLGCEWLAVVHADGNGLGEVFLHFDERARLSLPAQNRAYTDQLRQFSLALDGCTGQAFCAALEVLKPRGQHAVLPIVPLVLGGDDLTVVCDGRQAMKFVKKFTDTFEHQTRRHEHIKGILPDGVTTCAGVAIVKPHFPFHAAYELAEGLLKSAKTLAKDPHKQRPPFSAVDFHVLYDASGPDLDRIRAELECDGGRTHLVARPYAATAGQGPAGHRWEDLAGRVQAARARDEDNRRRLPNSMLHELREGLFFGRTTADYRLRLVRERYRHQGLETLLGATDGAGSLFWLEGQRHITGLLDALDLAEFWEGQE